MTKETENPKSYVIVWSAGFPHIKSSHFAPGYSKGHFATKQEALDAEVEKVSRELTDTRGKIDSLMKLTVAKGLE